MSFSADGVQRITLVVCLPLLGVFFVGFGAHIAYESLHGLAHRYDTLSSRGVRADASLVKCAPGIGGGRGVGCRLNLKYGSVHRTWDYPQNSSQFAGLRPGQPVTMLVDPAHPTVAYTVHDVEARTNTGLGPVFFLGAAFLVIGVAGLGWFIRFEWRTRRRP